MHKCNKDLLDKHFGSQQEWRKGNQYLLGKIIYSREVPMNFSYTVYVILSRVLSVMHILQIGKLNSEELNYISKVTQLLNGEVEN